MTRNIRWSQLGALVVLTLLATTTLTASAAGDETPDTLPLGPASDTFYVHQAKDIDCAVEAAGLADTNYQSAFKYATNVADDTCALSAEGTEGGSTVFSQSFNIQIHLLPALDQPMELVEGEAITGTLWLWTENVGSLSPRIHLQSSTWSADTDEGARITPASVELAAGERVWHRFDFDLGPAPAALGAGTVVLGVDLDNNADELRRVAGIRVGLGVTPGHKSVLELPLATQVDAPGNPVPVWPPALSTATVRPGVQHITNGAQCTTNFVFRDLDDGRLYMGTAAHCIDNVGVGGQSRIQTTGGGTAIVADVVFSTYETPGLQGDFALMRIPVDREQDVHPAVMHFGGPTGMADLRYVGLADKVITYGNSGLRPGNTPLDWHEGYVTGKNTYFTSVYTVTPGIFGDSGSGIMTRDGLALGAASTIAFAPIPGENRFSNIPTSIDWLNENGWNLEVQTWDLLDPGVLPGTLG